MCTNKCLLYCGENSWIEGQVRGSRQPEKIRAGITATRPGASDFSSLGLSFPTGKMEIVKGPNVKPS